MEEWVKQILKDERQKRGEPLDVKKIGQNYYLYQSTTGWVRGGNKRKKVSKYIGKLTERGIVQAVEQSVTFGQSMNIEMLNFSLI